MWDRQPPQIEQISISFWLSCFAFPNKIASKNDIALGAENFDSLMHFLEILFPFFFPFGRACLSCLICFYLFWNLSHLLVTILPQPAGEALLWFSEWAFQKYIIILSSYRRSLPETTMSYGRVPRCAVLKSPLQAHAEVSPPNQPGLLIPGSKAWAAL